jgi:hypothetical protein
MGGVIHSGHSELADEAIKDQLRHALADSPLDAFRHAFASALTARTTGVNMVIHLGDLHEGTEADKESSHAMDRYNNQIGAQIGAAHPHASDSEIESFVWEAMKDGQLQLSPHSQINYYRLKEAETSQ